MMNVFHSTLVLAATNNNWTINMGLFALSYFLGAICWAFINSDERPESWRAMIFVPN
jgi:hypothetical protein